MEVSARRFAILYAQDDSIVHANHYLDPGMQAIEYDSDELISTRIRYFRALRLLRRNTQHTVKSLQAILRDHVNYPDSICNHADLNTDPLDREKTINSLVIDLTARVMHLAWGNPCENLYHTFHLEG